VARSSLGSEQECGSVFHVIGVSIAAVAAVGAVSVCLLRHFAGEFVVCSSKLVVLKEEKGFNVSSGRLSCWWSCGKRERTGHISGS